MRIGQVAQVCGASVRALRHYEDEGLISPGRHPNGYRDYCPSTITRILQVRSLLQAGLPVRLIRELLPYLGEERVPAGVVCEEFLEKCRAIATGWLPTSRIWLSSDRLSTRSYDRPGTPEGDDRLTLTLA